MNYNLIAVTGSATSGKNTFINILQNILPPKINIDERAFATELRIELDPITRANFNISSFTKDPAEKSLIRNLMVSWADIRRKSSKGTYFWRKLEPAVLESLNNNNLVCISDFRFIEEYPEDEDFFVRKHNGIMVHITRFLPDGSVVPPANSTEAKFESKLREKSHYQIKWPTSNDMGYLQDLVLAQAGNLVKGIKNKYGIKE